MTGVLVEPVTTSPMRSLLRQRFSSRVDRALVFLSAEGEDQVAHPRGARARPYRRPSLAMVRRKAFDQVCWVSLVEYDAAVDIPNQASGWVQPTRSSVTWRVSDPVTAARKHLLAQDVPSWITDDLVRRGALGRRAEHEPVPEADDVTVPPGNVWDLERRVPEVGITYRIRRRPALPLAGSSAGPVMPAAWGEEQRAAYRFYRDVVAQGPYGLAALWLLHHPDQAREVLDWTVEHQTLLNDKTVWEHSMAALLQGLSDGDRRFVGVKVAELLSELGIPHADEVLDRVRGTQSPGYRKRAGEPQ